MLEGGGRAWSRILPAKPTCGSSQGCDFPWIKMWQDRQNHWENLEATVRERASLVAQL